MPSYSLEDAQVIVSPAAEDELLPTVSDRKLCDLVVQDTLSPSLDVMVLFILGCPLLTLDQKADCLNEAVKTEILKYNSNALLFNDVKLAF